MFSSSSGYGYYGATTDPTPYIIVSAILAIVAAVLLSIMVLPEKRRSGLNGFFKGIADIFNFKSLLIEKILRFLYVVLTIFAVLYGFFTMFMQSGGEPQILSGLLTMIISPILIRLIFEGCLMVVLLVKNVIEINNKLGNNSKKPTASEKPVNVVADIPAEPVTQEAPVEEKAVNVCPNCGTERKDDSVFCTNCGFKF